VTCTLLGPEGPGLAAARESGGGNGPLGLDVFPLVGERAGYRPYFENYTVDASILDSDLSGSGSQRRRIERCVIIGQFLQPAQVGC
jgi:hypothetical protein